MFFGTLMALAYIPQIQKILKRKSVEDISITMFIAFFIGAIAWLLYGLSIGNMFIVIPNVIVIVLIAAVIVLYFRYKRKR